MQSLGGKLKFVYILGGVNNCMYGRFGHEWVDNVVDVICLVIVFVCFYVDTFISLWNVIFF